MRLYGFFRSSAAFRVRIALGLKGLEAENVFIHLRRNEQRATDFLEVNPQGLVPALEEEGQVIIQSLAICEYLDETHPEPPILPGHPADRARVRALAEIVACDVHPLNNLRVLRYLAAPLKHDEATVAKWYNHWIAAGFEGFEKIVASDGQAGKFCHGDTPTLADICLVPQVYNARRLKVPLDRFPTIVAVDAACMKVEAFRLSAPENQPDAEP